MNTGRMTAHHIDTTEELLDCIRRFVGTGTVHSIEEAELLRLARRTNDEAQLLDYAYAFSQLAVKENGVFGQRFWQLFREAESFRAGMIERDGMDAA